MGSIYFVDNSILELQGAGYVRGKSSLFYNKQQCLDDN